MRMNGRRMSGNVEDRRGRSSSGMKIAGGGIVGVVVAALIAWLSGGSPLDVLTNGTLEQLQTGETTTGNYVPTEHERELETFVRQVLAGTEDVWTAEFRRRGLEYEPPRLVIFSGHVNSGCGGASASTGPFYCSADQTVYIDLSFFEQMEQQMKAGGDFAYAYVIAHEVGHHVQYLLGTLDEVHQKMSQVSETEANRLSVRNELQADYYAGVWAYHDNKMFGSLEPGDIEEGLNAASKIGDDYLQRQARGYVVPESFNHGRSDQRVRWLNKGASTGTVAGGDTFSVPYNSL